MFPGIELIMMVACAVFYYRAAEMEHASGLLWAGSSVGLWLGAAYVLHWGLLGCLATQVALFVGMTMRRRATIKTKSKRTRSEDET